MTEVTIVGIPSNDDPVWKISSEKVPHITLLYLGKDNDPGTVKRIADFVQHVASMTMHNFGLFVDQRGVLGNQEEDVLFFDKSTTDFQMLARARAYMLGNEDILKAYNSTEQFPTWTPHLTLGYPKAPAKNPFDSNRNDVYFDKIAVWTSDFDGPTFSLGSKYYPEDTMMAQTIGNMPISSLEHIGVKGMKWGVRKARKAERVRATSSTDARVAGDALAKAKKSGLHTLSNAELQSMVTRMNLEQQYSRLKPPSKTSKALKLVNEMLMSVGKQQVAKVANDVAAKQIGKLLAATVK